MVHLHGKTSHITKNFPSEVVHHQNKTANEITQPANGILEKSSFKKASDKKPALKSRIPPGTSELYKKVHKAKDTERSIVFSAIQTAVTQASKKETFVKLHKIPTEEILKEIFGEKVDREIARSKKTKPQHIASYDQSVIDMIKGNLRKPLDIKHAKCNFLSKSRLSALSSFAKLAKDEKKFNTEYSKLVNNIENITRLTSNKPGSLKDLNQAILHELRSALRNPTYQFLKEHEDHPAVNFLHSLCLATYAEPRILDSFKEIGKAIDSITHGEVNIPKCKKSGHEFADFVKRSRDSGYQHGLIRDTISFEYAKKAFGLIWGSVLSSKMGHFFSSMGAKLYDPRGDLENNAGALFDEKLKIGSKNCISRNVYTPTPTVGNHISDEIRGALQAMENRYFMSKEKLEKNPYPYTSWVYTNLQDITGANENPRSVAIMRLNDEYPFSFHGITLSLDSSFYLDGAKGNEQKVQLAIDTTKHEVPEDYKDAMNKQLCADENFTLKKRQNGSSGYYFPTRTQEERTEWKENLKRIAEAALKTVKETNTDKSWDWHVKAAFRELVHMGIIKYYQSKILKQLSSEKDEIDTHHMLTTNACKENIDRGGKTNATMLWALAENTQENAECVFSAIHARALLSRYRMILPDRLEPMYGLMKTVNHASVQKFLDVQTQTAGVETTSRATLLQNKQI